MKQHIASKAYSHIEKEQQNILYKYFKENSPCISTCSERRKGCHGNCSKERQYLTGYNALKTELLRKANIEKTIVRTLYSRRKGEIYDTH